jgi:hypothetical protein
VFSPKIRTDSRPTATATTLAIKIEFDEARRPNIGPRIHFHAVDDCHEILTPQPVSAHRVAQGTSDDVSGLSGVHQRDFSAPVRQKLILQRPRCLAVGNVVDLTAECINRVHGLATMVWQELRCPEKRAAGGANASGDCVVLNVALCRYRGLVRT